MTKDEMKNKRAERTRIFQQAMESCKSSNPIDCIEWFADKIIELEKKNAELRKIAEFQQFSNMGRHFENKKLKDTLAVGSTWNKHLNAQNKALEEERDKYRNMVFNKDTKLTKAKEIIKKFLLWENAWHKKTESKYELLKEAEQFLNSEVSE